jgi:predicted amidophosphoribosyltransferase
MLPALLGLLVPPACVACRRPPGPGDGVLCPDCRRALPWLGPDACARCGLPGCSRRCPALRLAYDRAWAPLAYAGPVPDLVRALKERGALRVSALMAAQIAATAPPDLLVGGVLVPVPADPARRRRRGLDHAGRIAEELAGRTGLEAQRLLARGSGPRQAGARRAARWDARRVAMCVRTRAAPRRVVLVDDVHTTGATLHACARALRAAGAQEVRAVTYGRTLP